MKIYRQKQIDLEQIKKSKKNQEEIEEGWLKYSPKPTAKRKISLLVVQILTIIGISSLIVSFIDILIFGYNNILLNSVTLVLGTIFVYSPFQIYLYVVYGTGETDKKVKAILANLGCIGLILSLFPTVFNYNNELQYQLYLAVEILLLTGWAFYTIGFIYKNIREQRAAVPDSQKYAMNISTGMFITSLLFNLWSIAIR